MANEFQGYSNMMNMQERAAERVRRMQMMEEDAARRANEELSGHKERQQAQHKLSPTAGKSPGQEGQNTRHIPMPVDYLHPGGNTPESSGHVRPAERPSSSPGTLLGGDQDSAMLLALILLLSRETSDPALILALMYIMI